MLQRPDRKTQPYTFYLEFRDSKKEVEYETLIIKLKLAKQICVRDLEVHSNSNIIILQVIDEYKAQEESMA